jgi:hypothetical protein
VIGKDPCFFRGTFWDGGDAVIRAQIVADPVSPTAEGVAYTRSSFTRIVYTLKREYKGKVTEVTGHINQSLTISSVVYDSLQPWSRDARGYNFMHVIDETNLSPIAKYFVDYSFTLASPSDYDFARYAKFQYLGDVDEGETVEPDPDPDPDPTPDDGVDPLLFSSITPVTVADTALETTLLHATNDVFQIAANSWVAGGVFSGESNGVVSTAPTLVGGITLRVKLGVSATLTFSIQSGDLPGLQDDIPWSISWSFTRQSEGASGTVTGTGELRLCTAGGETIIRTSSTGASPVVVDSGSAVPIYHTVEWDNSEATNTITRNGFFGRMAEVVA